MSEYPYAKCNDCEELFIDRGAMITHLSETFKSSETGHGHTGSVVNPTDVEIAHRSVEMAVNDAIYDCVEELDRKADRGNLTREQIRYGLRFYPDFLEAWDEYLEESA